MVDLIVVGGGYWGAAVCYEARRLGWSVIVIDDGDSRSGSRNASGIADRAAYRSKVFRKYLPRDWSNSDLDDSFCWLVDRGGYVVQENFWNRFAGTTPRKAGEAVYIDDPSVILRLATPRARTRVTEGSVGSTVCELSRLSARRLVVAAGYRTDEVLSTLGLRPLGVTGLEGKGLVISGNPTSNLPVSVMVKPYVKHTVRPWGRNYRVGDTAGPDPEGKKLDTLREIGKVVLDEFKELKVEEGFRPVADRFLVEKVGSNVVVATGGHRLGLGLCGLVAKKVLEAFR